ncbi:hypothetical protein L7F22_064125 [Adiantum nelumboides]|nr:hypothetical protein [Adiantum nelumboides]
MEMTDKPKENNREGFFSQDSSVCTITMQEDMIEQQGIMTEEQKEQKKDDITAKKREQGNSEGQENLQETETVEANVKDGDVRSISGGFRDRDREHASRLAWSGRDMLFALKLGRRHRIGAVEAPAAILLARGPGGCSQRITRQAASMGGLKPICASRRPALPEGGEQRW